MRSNFRWQCALMTKALFAVAFSAPAYAEADRWVPLWAASPQAVWEDGTLPLSAGLPDLPDGTAIEQPLTLSLQSDAIRVEFSNRYGPGSLKVVAGSVRCLDDDRREGPSVRVAFSGLDSGTVKKGGRLISDALPISGCRRIAVRARYYGTGGDFHWDARETSHFREPDGNEGTMTTRFALSAVYGRTEANGVIVTIGDSITDGDGAAMDSMTRWPDYLARLMATENISVINAGISGNRLLSDGMGSSVLSRLSRDALAVPGVSTVIVAIGTNDIAWPQSPLEPAGEPMTLECMQFGYRSMIAAAELAGIDMLLATIPPFEDALPGTSMGSTFWTPEKERLRREINEWLRKNHGSATLLDLDRLLADPDHVARLNPAYDSGDHLHPGATGNEAIATAVERVFKDAN